jgi:hypothetical protein
MAKSKLETLDVNAITTVETSIDAGQPATPMPGPTPKKKRFDPAELRINPSEMESTAVETQLLMVLVRKPHKQEFIRVHPDQSYRMLTPVIRLKEEGTRDDYFIVHPDVAPHLADEISYAMIYACVNRQGSPFLWPVMWPSTDGRPNAWLTTAHQAAEYCITGWARVVPVQDLQSYVLKKPRGIFSDPIWPTQEMGALLELGFGADHLIDSLDHPVVKRLRGIST